MRRLMRGARGLRNRRLRVRVPPGVVHNTVVGPAGLYRGLYLQRYKGWRPRDRSPPCLLRTSLAHELNTAGEFHGDTSEPMVVIRETLDRVSRAGASLYLIN